MQTQPDFLVIDLEATCDDRGAVPKERMEVIELGAVLVHGVTLDPLREFQSFVRPVRHPELTAFCTQLTTITQEQVAGAPTFVEMLRALRVWLGGERPLFSSWGAYDKRQLEQDARHWGVALPLGAEHFNVKLAFFEKLGLRKKLGVGQALAHCGMRFEGTAHRGIDDARNIARLLPWALGRGPAAP